MSRVSPHSFEKKTMEDVENVKNPSTGFSDEIPQAQATLIGGVPNANNDCPICVGFQL